MEPTVSTPCWVPPCTGTPSRLASALAAQSSLSPLCPANATRASAYQLPCMQHQTAAADRPHWHQWLCSVSRWHMTGVDITPIALKHAEANVQRNPHLQRWLTVRQSAASPDGRPGVAFHTSCQLQCLMSRLRLHVLSQTRTGTADLTALQCAAGIGCRFLGDAPANSCAGRSIHQLGLR